MIILFPASLSIDDHYKLNVCTFGGVVQQTYTVVTCFYKDLCFSICPSKVSSARATLYDPHSCGWMRSVGWVWVWQGVVHGNQEGV